MSNDSSQKRIDQAEYRARLVESELVAIKKSKAYKLSKTAGIIKAQIKSDPVGLSKKAARIVFKEPSKLRHVLRSANRGALIAQSVVEQNSKYQEWIILNEPDELELDEQRKVSDKFKNQPLISIITPVFNPPVDVLEDLIESVLEQTYHNLELCLGNFGTNEDVVRLIDKYAKYDPRVKHYPFTENKGIAYNSNLILEKAEGEFVALLDHDDTLSHDALYENVKLLNQKSYDFIYSDKDKIDLEGNRFDPLFKPQLSPEMLLNVNYLTHLNVMRTSLVKKVGAWDSDTDGAQDWDLFLRVVAAAKNVGHIPKILYHWRVIESSTAMSIETKPYALAGQRKAVDKYLDIKGIPATSYHEKTELFLNWNNEAIDDQPIVFLEHTSVSNTIRSTRCIKKAVRNPKIIIWVQNADKKQKEQISRKTNLEVFSYTSDSFAQSLGEYLEQLPKNQADNTVLFLQDNITLPKKTNWYEDLTGWLAIEGVAGVSGRVVNRNDLIVSSGGIVTQNSRYFPIFHGYPRYYQSYIGNAEWVRNLSAIPMLLTSTKLSLLKSYEFSKDLKSKSKQATLDSFVQWLTLKHRLVMTPHVTGSIYEDVADTIDSERPLNIQSPGKNNQQAIDKFSNANLSASDPMRLFHDEPLVGIDGAQKLSAPIDRYQHDAIILANSYDITAEQMEQNQKIVSNTAKIKEPQSVAWFLPSFDAVYAGLMNIFSFADYLERAQKIQTNIYILKSIDDVSNERELAEKAFPSLKKANFISITSDSLDKIEECDIGIATQWASAYPLAKANNIKRKCYFIQDNESNFYPKGSISSLVDLSYKFGFTAIANTDGLLEHYKIQYAGQGVVLKSKVDLSAYFPRKEPHYTPKAPYKVFFYARPSMPRNAFELGIAGLKSLKADLGRDVEIITAGAPWEPSDYGVEGLFTNLGKIEYKAVPKLYRSMDAGLMFMFSGHPGVTASELMASGCPVVVNEYDDMTWHELYKHEETCLVTAPTSSEVARNIKRCLVENDLRKRLISNGIKVTKEFYSNYEKSQEEAFNKIIYPDE